METDDHILVWRIPSTEEPVGYSPRGCKESETTVSDTVSLIKKVY